MPRISRGSPTGSPSQEPVRNTTSPSSPNAAGGASAGRRERQGLLGFLARPFRGSGQSTRASGHANASAPQPAEQAPASQAAPRTASALLQRSPALARGHGEEVMARVARTQAETPELSPRGSPSNAPARGTLARQAAPRHTPETPAGHIVQQPRSTPTGLRPLPTPEPVRNRQTPARAGGRPAQVPSGRTQGANPSPMGRLAGAGIDTGRIAAAIDDTLLRGRELPSDIRGALQNAGIETHINRGRVPIDHPLLQLRREIHLATPEERDPSPPRAERLPIAARRPPRLGIPPIGTSRARGPATSAPSTRLTMPTRTPGENNAQYAWRLHNLNPGASLDRIAAAAVGETARFNLRPTRLQLDAMIKARDEFRAAFSSLRPISKADAERIGFKDAQNHGEDEATQCLFGEPLSTSHPEQRVIALASEPLDQTKPYSAEDMKGLEFMDLNALANHLANKPEHLSNRAQLDANNIRDYAFRIE